MVLFLWLNSSDYSKILWCLKNFGKLWYTISIFTRHAEDYETVFTVHGILGETPRRLYIRGQGSYDEKHEAILNV